MEFKDLISLANDNKSFAQKKLLRDQIIKNKQREKSRVSDSAVQAYLARKQKEQRQLKVAEDAARRQRIEERLESAAVKGKTLNKNDMGEKSTSSGNAREGKVNAKLEDLRRQNLRHLNGTTTSSDKRKLVSKKNESHEHSKQRHEKSKQKLKSNKSMDFKDLMKFAKSQTDKEPSKSDLSDFKQQRRKKGSSQTNFEWSGSINSKDAKEGNDNAMKTEKQCSSKTEAQRQMGSQGSVNARKKEKKKDTSVNFKDLMRVARQQIDKSDMKQDINSKNIQVNERIQKVQRKVPPAQAKPKLLDINSVSFRANKVENPTKECNQNERPRGCTLVTKTIKSQRNYEPVKSVLSSLSTRMKSRTNGAHHNGINGNKRKQIPSIDEELEHERRALEKKRDMLKRKMQGNAHQEEDDLDLSAYYEDDYDDEMDDFIDDEGEETDYSRHIRSIFGYDRRRFDDDDDVDDMEASYSQIVAEESRSLRIARLEDEIEKRREDMQLSRAKKRRR